MLTPCDEAKMRLIDLHGKRDGVYATHWRGKVYFTEKIPRVVDLKTGVLYLRHEDYRITPFHDHDHYSKYKEFEFYRGVPAADMFLKPLDEEKERFEAWADDYWTEHAKAVVDGWRGKASHSMQTA